MLHTLVGRWVGAASLRVAFTPFSYQGWDEEYQYLPSGPGIAPPKRAGLNILNRRFSRLDETIRTTPCKSERCNQGNPESVWLQVNVCKDVLLYYVGTGCVANGYFAVGVESVFPFTTLAMLNYDVLSNLMTYLGQIEINFSTTSVEYVKNNTYKQQ